MTDNEFILQDRLGVIRDTIHKYGEENFYISFSGGKDSTVVHHLVDMALPDNKIPRVFSNTGIEFNAIVEFVQERKKEDSRFVMIQPSCNIKKTLEKYGYPFKSKLHSKWVAQYQKSGRTWAIENYLGEGEKKLFRPCPDILKYQFTDDFKLKVSDQCCLKMKEEPVHKWQKENNKPYGILGIMQEEGGRRFNSGCLAFRGGKLKNFQPLAKVTHEWEKWFIDEYKIPLCKLYYEPYNFDRTGCKGCPFALHLENDLQVMKKYFSNEYEQCQIIWQPVYEEYRRIGYRLKREEQTKLF